MKFNFFVSVAVVALGVAPSVLRGETTQSIRSVQRASLQKASTSVNVRVHNKAKSSLSNSSSAVLASSGLEALYGFLEFRPSYNDVQKEAHSENTAEVGYKMAPNLQVGYVQYYNVNLINSSPTTQGLNLLANDGFAYFKAKEIWQSPDKHLSASYQLRLFTPTSQKKFQEGYITSVRNQFLLNYKFNNFVSVDLSYHPILHVYNKAGSLDSKGLWQASPSFNHQWIFQPVIHPAANFTFVFPVVYQVTQYKQFAGAANSQKWKKSLSFSPELDYEVNSMHTVGIAFYTESVMSEYGRGFDFSSGFKTGTAQLVWGINL